MQKRRSNRFDNIGIGVLIGFILPAIVFFTVYLINQTGSSLSEFTNSLNRLNVLLKVGSLCVFVNSVVFMGLIKLKYEKIARGILGATMVYAFIILISKVF